MFSTVRKVDLLAIKMNGVGLNSIIHQGFHLACGENLEFSFLMTEGDLVSLAKGNGELEKTEEFEDTIGEECRIVSLSNSRYSKAS